MILIKLNLDLVEQHRLFKGQKGTYLDAVLFENDEPDKYGNTHTLIQSVSQEERKANVKGRILGNGKLFERKESSGNRRSESREKPGERETRRDNPVPPRREERARTPDDSPVDDQEPPF